VLSVNLHRRHLTAGQKAAIAAEAEPMLAEAAKGRRHRDVAKMPDPELGRAREKAAELTGASPRYVQDAKAIKEG
jgi:hypothetical protein